MNERTGPIWNLTRHLEARCRNGGSAETMQSLHGGGLDLAGASTLVELVAACHGAQDRVRVDEVLSALVAVAGRDELATLAVLVVLRPALLTMSKRLLAAGVEPDEAQTDVVTAAYERVRALAGCPPRHVARAVVSGAWDHLRWSLAAQQRCALRRVPLEAAGDPTAESVSAVPDGHRLSEVLRAAVAGGVVTAEAALVIHATRVEARSFDALACELHKGVAAVRKSRQRAERALVDCGHRARRDRARRGSRSRDCDLGPVHNGQVAR